MISYPLKTPYIKNGKPRFPFHPRVNTLFFIFAISAISTILFWEIGSVRAAEDKSENKSASYSLISKRVSGTVDQVERKIDVQGKLIFEVDVETGESTAKAAGDDSLSAAAAKNPPRNAKKREQKIPMHVSGIQTYEEMLVTRGNLLQGEKALPTLGVWAFLKDEVKITVDKDEQSQTLNPNGLLFGLNIHDAKINYFRPGDLLTREEKDLLDQQGNTLLVDFLLPNRKVKIGESWNQPPELMGLMLQLEMVYQMEVTTTLEEVKNNTAILKTAGWIEGSSDGTASKIELTGQTYFHIPSGRITWNGLIIKETRSAGHVAPGMEVTARLQYTIKPLAKSEKLTEETVSKIVFEDSQAARLLCLDPGGVWRCEMDARWFATSYNPESATFRMVDKGDLIAQCTITTSPSTQSPPDITLNTFQDEIKKSLQGTIEAVADSSQIETEDGTKIYRVEFTGKVDDLPLNWTAYRIYKPAVAKKSVARQIMLIFTVEEKLVEAFQLADQTIIQTFQWEK